MAFRRCLGGSWRVDNRTCAGSLDLATEQVDLAELAEIPLRVLRGVAELVQGHITLREGRDLGIEDGLGHAQVGTDLGAGDRFAGPAIVEERETTSVIRRGWQVEVAADGSLVATRTPDPASEGADR